MYNIYFYCIFVTSAFANGNGDDTKYIDLLPEAEKEEFLNRIARRIIEEIQSKDSPEQSHTEVSDDQLNAHNTYVQDLIKEESENMRKERRSNTDSESIKSRTENDEMDKDNKQNDNIESDAGKQHIDLTLRNQKEVEKNERKQSDDSTFNVIPVKVVYAQENNEITATPTNISYQYDPTTRISVQKDNDNAKNLNDSKSESGGSGLLSNPDKGKVTNSQSYFKNTHSVTQASENHLDLISTKDFQTFVSNNQNLSHDLVQDSTILYNTDNFSTVNNNNDDSFENSESSTQTYISSNKITDNKNISPTESEDELSTIDTTIRPVTTQNSITYNSNQSENVSSTIVYVTTVQSTRHEPFIKGQTDIVSKVHDIEGKAVIKTKKDKATNVKKHLRTRLQVFSQEYTVKKRASREKNNKEKRNENKNIKQYFVYEVPKENSVFVEAEDKKGSEQHYAVPIYNFAPENAYYTARNRFDLNKDEADTHKQIVPDPFDKELYLRSGFEIDIKSRQQKNKRIPYEDWLKYPRHSHWKHILQSKLEHIPLFNDNQDNINLRTKIKRDNNLKVINRHKKKDDTFKIPDKIIYIPLRKYGQNILEDKEVTPKNVNKFYFDYKKPNPTENDHVRAVKNFLYQQQKFGYLSPSRVHYFPRSNKRALDVDSDLKMVNNRKRRKEPKNDIDLDYYFLNKLNNKTNGGNSNEEEHFEDIIAKHKLFFEADEGNRKISMKNYRMPVEDDCEHGCIEMDLKTPTDEFYNHLEALIKVLEDMIYRDKKDLVTYDWLLSTIDLKSAIKKLKDLTETIEKGNKIHALDLKLLNYIVYLYNQATYKLENTIHSNHRTKAVQDIKNIVNRFLSLLRRRIALPKSKNTKHEKKLTNPVNFWYKHYVRVGMGSDTSRKDDRVLTSFKNYLNDLEDNMFELHDALKHIALITTYFDQNWYKDLKNIYLKSASKKQLLQVILHLAASRLFSSIEETAKKAEEDELYKDNNGEEVRRIQEEFIFVLRILESIKKIHQ